MGAGVSMEAGYSKGGHDRNYSEFLVQAKNMLKVCQINALHEAVGQMQERQEILSKAPRLSQHLPGEVAWRAPGGWEGASNPQHQQWLELRRAIDTNAFEKRQRSRDAEDGEMTYALLACAGVNQMVTRLINCSRGNAPYDDNENALASRVANCLAPILGINDTPESAARSVLCNLSAAAEGHRKLLPPEWNGRFPERYVTTGVNVAARILHQTAILQIRLPGCQPVEDFHLYQTRKIRFSWDERANFITAQVVDHSDWMCSTREPQVAEDARFARGRF